MFSEMVENFQPPRISEEAINIRQTVNARRILPIRRTFEAGKSGDGVILVDEEVQKEDWKWPCFEEYNEPGRGVVRRKIESIQQSDIVPFKIVYDNTENFCRTFVELSSQSLIKILRDILLGNNDILKNAPRVQAQDLYHVMKELRDAASLLESVSEPTSESATETEKASDLAIKKIHLKHLIRFLEHEYDQTAQNYERMLSNKVVSFDMLWVFYTKNLNVLYRCKMSGQHIGGIISSTRERFDHFTKQRFFSIHIKIIDYDGHGFKHCSILREIGHFDGEESFFDLLVIPLEFSNYLKNTIADNGKRFFDLAPGSTFMNYEGPLLRKKMVDNCIQIEKIRADGRVMIDILSFAAMNPGYLMGNAIPPSKCGIEISSRKGDYIDQIHEKDYYHLAPAVVYGFSFALKEWGQFEVLKFKEIDFDTEAFSNLVMPSVKKDMLEGLVKHYEKPSGNEVNDISAKPLDPVTNKGNGCIFLCYGPPGTGKTLTAECVAESLQRPLWMLSVHELGMKPDDLERQLVKILNVAFTWKAVLLLDEADIYLEKRGTSDIKRNAMVGIFLRHLEYYRGVLFLTTNRVMNFDDAICSRVNMFFYYPKLDLEGKHEVWTNFIRRANLPLNADDFVKYDLNGREIRNILHTAQLLVKSKGKDLTADTVIEIIKTFKGFQEEMEEIKNNPEKKSKEIKEV